MKKETREQFCSMIEDNRIHLIFGSGFVIIGAISFLFSLIALGKLFTALFSSIVFKDSVSTSIPFNWIIMFLFCYVIFALFSYFSSLLFHYIFENMSKKCRRLMMVKLSRLSLSYYEQQIKDHDFYILSCIDWLDQHLVLFVRKTMFLVTFSIVGLTLLLFLEASLTLLVLLLVVVVIIIEVYFMGRKGVVFKKTEASELNMNHYLKERYNGQIVVKSFRNEKQSMERFERYNSDYSKKKLVEQFLLGMKQPLLISIISCFFILLIALGGAMVVHQTMSFGAFITFLFLSCFFGYFFRDVVSLRKIYFELIIKLDQLFTFFNLDEVANTTDEVNREINGSISVQSLRFDYGTKFKLAIDELKIRSSQKVAVVGNPGSGKTTFLKLLMGFYSAEPNMICYDGVDGCNLGKKQRHQLMSYVSENPWLFYGTIRENVLFGRRNSTDQEMKEVLDRVGADYFIHTLPDSYNTLLDSSDMTLTTGQKQLLCMARSLLSNAPILICDNGLTEVDSSKQKMVVESLLRDTEQTLVLVTDSIDILNQMDLILFFEDGSIVEKGKHKTLIRKKGSYYQYFQEKND